MFKKQLNKKIFSIIAIMLILLNSWNIAFAETVGNVNVEPIEPLDTSNNQPVGNRKNFQDGMWAGDVQKQQDGTYNVGLPKATMKDAENWVDRKGSDVISLIQRASQTIMIIIFIAGAFIAAGGGRRKGSGFVMMGLAIMSQAAILYAPELMEFFQNWIAS